MEIVLIPTTSDVTTAVPDIPTLILNSPNPDYTGSIELSWAAVYGGFEYYVFRNTTQIASVTGLNSIAQFPYSPFTYTILAPGTYYYVVTAADQIGNSPLSNCINITVSVPITPVKNLIFPNPSVTGSITLSWNANPWATGFYLFKNTSSDHNGIGIEFHCQSYHQFVCGYAWNGHVLLCRDRQRSCWK